MIYLDHAATSPVRPECIAAMTKELGQAGNPSATHQAGRRAWNVVDDAREAIADAMGTRPSEVVFTAGGTEADNLAIKGIYWARQAADPARRRILVPKTEHHAVLDAVTWLVNHQGAEVTWLPVTSTGGVDVVAAQELITQHHEQLALVSLMWANNETGVLHDLLPVAEKACEFGVPVHTDATQAAGRVQIDFATLPITALTISAHKLGGPVGAGALLLEAGCAVEPVHHGGGQERKIRSGTLDPVNLAGFGVAVQLAETHRVDEGVRLATLRNELAEHIVRQTKQVVLSGPELQDPHTPDAAWHRLPQIAHFTIGQVRGEALLYRLDEIGICASGGSACSAGVQRASHVVEAMGVPAERAQAALRLSLGHTTTAAEIQRAKEQIAQAIISVQPPQMYSSDPRTAR